MTLAITGAYGFIGRALSAEFANAGRDVTALVRNPRSGEAPAAARRYDLAAPLETELLTGVDEVIHCAFERHTAGKPDSADVNVRGTLALFERASALGLPFTFISSLSAVPGALSRYGQQKYALEQLLAERGAWIVRPGLVVGDGGLARATFDAMSRTHLIPLIDGGRQPVQCVGLSDLARIVRAFVERKPMRSITVASAQPITARRLVLGIRDRFALRALAVPVPLAVLLPAVRAAETLRVPVPLTSENLLGLQRATTQAVTDVEGLLGVRLAPWDELLRDLTFRTPPNAREST